jgi:L-rhamnose mutarotase
MIRRAFTMRLKPDSSAEYKYHHDNIWPELVAEIQRSGIARITTFQRGLDLFLFSEIEDADAWDRLWSSEVHKQWAEVMEPLMHLREDGVVDAGELVEVFHFAIGEDRREPVAALASMQVEHAPAEAFASSSAPDDRGDGGNYVLGEATDEDLAEDMHVDQLATDVVKDPLAELIADTAYSDPLARTPLDGSPPQRARAPRRRAVKKKPARKAKSKPAKIHTARAARVKTKKKKAAKKPARKKSVPSKKAARKPAKKKAAKKRAKK